VTGLVCNLSGISRSDSDFPVFFIGIGLYALALGFSGFYNIVFLGFGYGLEFLKKFVIFAVHYKIHLEFEVF